MAKIRASKSGGGGGGSGATIQDTELYTSIHSDNWSSYQTMLDFTTLSSVTVEVESYFNGSSTGQSGYPRQCVIDGVITTIPTSPNIQTITIPAGKSCQLQQYTNGNNYPNQLRVKFS